MAEVVALVGAVAKLIGVGVAAWKASEEAGCHVEEFEALKEALETFADLGERFGKDPERTLVEQHLQLVTVAFGEAWRRHWHDDERLAPAKLKSGWFDRFRRPAVSARIEQVEDALRNAKVMHALASAAHSSDLDALDRLGEDPLRSPWYKALWEAFRQQTEPALLLLEHGGESKRTFERHVRVAFREGLTSERARSLRERFLTRQEDRSRVVRDLLAARLAGFRDESIFPPAVTGLPHLPLCRLYVEPRARADRNHDTVEPRPIVEMLEAALRRAKTRIVLVLADFGKGKSLTARTLAHRLAERFLQDTDCPSSEIDYPIFVRCQEALTARSLDIETTVRRGQKKLADPFLPASDQRDPAFGLHAGRRTVVLLDGLDEVQLMERETVELFANLCGHASDQCRFIVFSRPAAVPAEIRRLDDVSVFHLDDFDGTHIERWLENWRALTPEPHPSFGELEKHGLFGLARIPVLLFMIAQAWDKVRSLREIGRVDVYEQFVELTIHSKLRYEQRHHPIVAQAAERLRDALVARGHLDSSTSLEAAMLLLLGRVAWQAHCHQQASEAKPTTTLDLLQILNEWNVETTEIYSICRGVVLTFQTSLTDAAQELHFAHKSFREFLVAKFWEVRLRALLALESHQRAFLERELMKGRLLAANDQSFAFLLELCAQWPRALQGQLIQWTKVVFNNEQLSEMTLLEDKRFALREAALAIGSHLSESGLKAESTRTLRTLLASLWAAGRKSIVVASRIEHPGALLFRADLADAKLSGANLVGADLSEADLSSADLRGAKLCRANVMGADLHGADLSGADLVGADLRGALVGGVKFRGANLRGVDLSRQDLSKADLGETNLRGADLRGALLTGAHLVGANLCGANLSGANLEDAKLDGADLSGASLSGARVSADDLCRAKGTLQTLLPGGVTRPMHWQGGD